MHKQLNAKVNALEEKLKTMNNNLISTISVAEGRLQTKENNLQSAVNALQGSVQAMSSKIGKEQEIIGEISISSPSRYLKYDLVITLRK